MIFQPKPVKEKVGNSEFNRLRNDFIVDAWTLVDIQKIIKFRSRVVETIEGVIYRENFEMSPFRKVIEKSFVLRQNYKGEGSNLMQGLVKLVMNSLFGVQNRKEIIEYFECKSQN